MGIQFGGFAAKQAFTGQTVSDAIHPGFFRGGVEVDSESLGDKWFKKWEVRSFL